jgi:hypothetical protein
MSRAGRQCLAEILPFALRNRQENFARFARFAVDPKQQ